MDTQNLFQIGNMAKMFHLSISSLRHYEAIGLLPPEYIDPETGYRYYSVRQFDALSNIRYLRALGVPLSEIADFLHNRDVAKIEEKLFLQKEVVRRKQAELARIERKIDTRLHQLHDAQTSVFDRIEEVTLPACRVCRIDKPLRVSSYHDMDLPANMLGGAQPEALVFLGKVGVGITKEHLRAGIFMQYDSFFLVIDAEDDFKGEAVTQPKAQCVRVRFHGSHTEAPAQYEKLMRYITAHRLGIAGDSREITVIDYGITNDTEKFVTEICIPIENP